MDARFRLLGDVDVYVDGRRVEVGHARQRVVLAALLVDANRVVPGDHLLDRVWGTRLPQRAGNTLAGYLSRLRRVLADTGVAITSRSGGYLLAVDPLWVDLHRFHHLVAQARDAPDESDARAWYDEALGLWRGEAFGALSTPWLEGMRVALRTQRLAVELERNDLAIAGGRHVTVLSGLLTRTAEYPLDERLAGQLMLVLSRCGRQADALYRFEQIRRRLAEELGIDPSPPLRELHRRILNHDPDLVSTWSDPQAAQPVPRQLPVPPPAFVGRAAELAALDALLDGAAAVAAVSGTAGVGKTALVLHWAHRVRERFPDGQLHVNLRGFDVDGQVSSADALGAFLAALAVPADRIPDGQDARVALYRSLISGRRMLVVVDNARDSRHARPLLPATSTAVAVVTSRTLLTGLVAADGAQPLVVDLPSAAEALELLAGRLSERRVAAEPQAVEQIIVACARLPLALTIVAARAATHPAFTLSALADELTGSGGGLDALDAGEVDSPARTFAWSYIALSPAAARLFRLLGPHPGPDISRPAAASLVGLPPPRTRALLAELANASLLTEHLPGRYTFHDLLRTYAMDVHMAVDDRDERYAAARRLLDHYLHSAYAADRLLNPHRDPLDLTPPAPGVTPEAPADHAQALAWLSAERSVLLAAVAQAARTGFDTHCWQMAFALATFLTRQGYWHEQIAAGRVAVAAVERLGEPSAQAYVHRLLARAYGLLGRYPQAGAEYERALHASACAGDHVGAGHSLLELSVVLDRQGDTRRALHAALRALARYRSATYEPGQATVLNQIGWCHLRLGDCQAALSRCEQALRLSQRVGDRYTEAATWDSLGLAHQRLGHHVDAVGCYEHALDLFRDLGDHHQQALTLMNLGEAQRVAGQRATAAMVWGQALTILDRLGAAEADAVRTRLGDLGR